MGMNKIAIISSLSFSFLLPQIKGNGHGWGNSLSKFGAGVQRQWGATMAQCRVQVGGGARAPSTLSCPSTVWARATMRLSLLPPVVRLIRVCHEMPLTRSTQLNSILVHQGVIGLVCNDTTFGCKGCRFGSRHNSRTLLVLRSNHPFDLVHSDVWGPTLFASKDDPKYYVIFVDETLTILGSLHKGFSVAFYQSFLVWFILSFPPPFASFVLIQGGILVYSPSISFLRALFPSFLVLVLIFRTLLLSASIVTSLRLFMLLWLHLLSLLISRLRLFLCPSISATPSHPRLFRASALERSCLDPLLVMITFWCFSYTRYVFIAPYECTKLAT